MYLQLIVQVYDILVDSIHSAFIELFVFVKADPKAQSTPKSSSVGKQPDAPVSTTSASADQSTSHVEDGGGDSAAVTTSILLLEKPPLPAAHEGQGDAGVNLQSMDSPLQMSLTSSGFEKLTIKELDNNGAGDASSRVSTPPGFSMIASLPPTEDLSRAASNGVRAESDAESVPEEDIAPAQDDDDGDYEDDFESDDDVSDAVNMATNNQPTPPADVTFPSNNNNNNSGS